MWLSVDGDLQQMKYDLPNLSLWEAFPSFVPPSSFGSQTFRGTSHNQFYRNLTADDPVIFREDRTRVHAPWGYLDLRVRILRTRQVLGGFDDTCVPGERLTLSRGFVISFLDVASWAPCSHAFNT